MSTRYFTYQVLMFQDPKMNKTVNGLGQQNEGMHDFKFQLTDFYPFQYKNSVHTNSTRRVHFMLNMNSNNKSLV